MIANSRAEHLAAGDCAERRACQYLEERGLHLRQRNFRTRLGEIDLIMDDGPVLAFVEVRYRKPGALVSPLESITPTKAQRITRAATQYLQARPELRNRRCRFDVVAISDDIRWIQAAFEA